MYKLFSCKNNMFHFLASCISLSFFSFSLASDLQDSEESNLPLTAHPTRRDISQGLLNKVTDYLEGSGYSHFEIAELLQDNWDYYAELVSARTLSKEILSSK